MTEFMTAYIDVDHYWNILRSGIPLLLLGYFLMYVNKFTRDHSTKFDDNNEMFVKNNGALGLATCAQYIAVLIAISGVLRGESANLFLELQETFWYGIFAMLMMWVSRYTADKVLFHSFSIDKELIEDQNPAVAWGMAGNYLAIGFIVAGAISGESVDMITGTLTALYYFGLTQIVFLGAGLVYEWITPYSFKDEISEKDNESAGIALFGFLTALGYGLGNAVSGNMTVSIADTLNFGFWAILTFVILAIARKFVAEYIYTRGHSLQHEIVNDRNNAAGWMLTAAYLGSMILFSAAI